MLSRYSDDTVLRQLQRDHESASKAFRDHWDGCRACNEFAWEGSLCIDGGKLSKKMKDLGDELEWKFGADV